MSNLLFSPLRVGSLSLKNRFMRSATYEGLAYLNGSPMPQLLDMMKELANNEVGLIVPGAVAVSHTYGFLPHASRLCSTEHALAWKPAIKEMHKRGAAVVFQVVGPIPLNPPTGSLSTAEIEDQIQLFRNAAALASFAGADGIQFHACHGSFLSHVLSPAFNKRVDKYGGSLENRIRIIKEITHEIRTTLPDLSVSMKINGNDHLPDGNRPLDVAEEIHLLEKDIDFFEISSNLSKYSYSIRSNIHKESLLRGIPDDKKEEYYNNIVSNNIPYVDAFHLNLCKIIREKNPNVKLALVGGLREIPTMENILKSGVADIVSISRPFLRQPDLITRFKNGTTTKASCVNCGTCIFKIASTVCCHYRGK